MKEYEETTTHYQTFQGPDRPVARFLVMTSVLRGGDYTFVG